VNLSLLPSDGGRQNSNESQPEAIEAYRIAAQSEDPPGRALAQNNIGVLLLLPQ